MSDTADMLAIFRARKAELGMSNCDFEAAANLGEGNASRILSGAREVRAGTVERICRALKLEQKFVPTVACDFGESSERGDCVQNERTCNERHSLNSGTRSEGTAREAGS